MKLVYDLIYKPFKLKASQGTSHFHLELKSSQKALRICGNCEIVGKV